jgi:pimeloyl-ACP methyl ester carboxylesterase
MERIVFVHGSVSNGAATWSGQRVLADRFELEILNRPGFPPNPPVERVDFAEHAAWVVERLRAGDHLVGHSYGGVVSLLAAARRPDSVRSLVLIEPPAFGVARGDPAVEELIRNVDIAAKSAADPAEYRAGFLRSFGFPAKPVPLEGDALTAARASMTERPPGDAEIPLDDLARSGLRVLLVQGDWCPAPASARGLAGAAFRAVCDVLDDSLNAERAIFPSAHSPQKLGTVFNHRLRAFWETA